jgi:hypothetical protein
MIEEKPILDWIQRRFAKYCNKDLINSHSNFGYITAIMEFKERIENNRWGDEF